MTRYFFVAYFTSRTDGSWGVGNGYASVKSRFRPVLSVDTFAAGIKKQNPGIKELTILNYKQISKKEFDLNKGKK